MNFCSFLRKYKLLMLYRLFIWYLLLFSPVFVLSQNINEIIQDLESKISSKEDTNLVIVFNDLTWYYRFVSTDKAKLYGQKAIDLSKKLNFKKGEAQAYNDLGILFADEKKYNEALNYYNKALEIRKKLNDKKGIAACFNKMGIVEQERGNFKTALDFQLKSLKAFEELKNDNYIATSLNNIGVLLFDNMMYDESIKYHLKALDLRKSIGDTLSIGSSFSNIGNVYLKKQDLKSALTYYKLSIDLLEAINEKNYITAAYNNISSVYTNMNRIDSAIYYAEKGYALRKKINDKKGIASSASNLGNLYSITGKESLAMKMLEEAKKIALEINIKPELESIYKNLWRLYEKQGNYKTALIYASLHNELKDSILNESNNKAIAEMKEKYESEKKEIENKILESKNKYNELELNKKNQLIFYVVVILILVMAAAIISFAFLRLKSEKVKNELLLKAEQERFKATILGQEKERKRIAEELHDGVGQMLSAVKMNVASLDISDEEQIEHFKSILNMIDSSCNEVRNISHAMMPGALLKLGLYSAIKDICENLSLKNKLKINFESNGSNLRLDESIEINLFRIVQELLQNTMKYAKADEINLKLLIDKNNLNFTYSDNGIGFDSDKIKHSPGIGWSNILSRITLLNANYTIYSEPNKGMNFQMKMEKIN